MTDYPRRNQAGDLVPWLADWIRGNREADRLQDQGLTVDRDQASLTELGRALEPVPDPDRRAELLAQVDQLQQRNRVERRALEQAPDTAPETGAGARDLTGERGAAFTPGHLDHAARGQGQAPVRNEKIDPITEYLRKVPDPPDEEWS